MVQAQAQLIVAESQFIGLKYLYVIKTDQCQVSQYQKIITKDLKP